MPAADTPSPQLDFFKRMGAKPVPVVPPEHDDDSSYEPHLRPKARVKGIPKGAYDALWRRWWRDGETVDELASGVRLPTQAVAALVAEWRLAMEQGVVVAMVDAEERERVSGPTRRPSSWEQERMAQIDGARVYRVWRQLVDGGDDEPMGALKERFGLSERAIAGILAKEGRVKANRPGNVTRKALRI